MPKEPKHPTNDELAAFSLGQLPTDAASRVEKHVSECEPCCETIVHLSSEDTFVDLLQKVGTETNSSSDKSEGDFTGSDGDSVPTALSQHTRYEIQQLVGRGGMGQVFKARHRMMDRTVALKVIHQAWVRKKEAIDRFRREMKTAASLDHPNVVTAYDAEQADELHFLVMEYVDGVDLAETVKKQGPLSVTRACDLVRQAALGLQYAHDRGMVHRDIKPHNLMVTNEGTVKILDFGLASLAPQPTPEEPISEDADGNLTIAGAIMGTPDFISPEQAEDAHQVDGRSDIYSLGMTLYFLLSGRVPFREGSAADKLKLHAEAYPVKLKQVAPDVPEGVQEIFERMTAKDPAERFQSPQEVADALQNFFAEPPESVSKGTSKSDRFPWWLVASVVLFAALGAFMYTNDHLLTWSVPTESDVYAPVSELESYVASMAASPHELVFMNVYELGSDNVAVGFKASEDGVLMDIDVSSSGRRQSHGRDANKMKAIASTLSVPVTEEAQIAPDGTISGVSFKFLLQGDPSDIAKNAYQIIFEGLALNSDKECQFQCSNLPNTLVKGDDYSASRVSADEFVAEYENGNKVFLGENQQHFFLVPEARRYELPLTMNEEVWYTYVRNLPPGFARKVRFQAAREWHTHQIEQSSSQNSSKEERSQPELKIETKTVTGGGNGLPKVRTWQLSGREVGDCKVRLWLAQDGKADVFQEFDFDVLPSEFDSQIRLEVSDAADVQHRRSVNAILYVKSPVNSETRTTNEGKMLSISLDAPFATNREQADLRQIEAGQQIMLLAQSYWKGDLQHGTSMQSMTEATADGTAVFLFVTVEWEPTGKAAAPEASSALPRPSRDEILSEEKNANVRGTPRTNPAGFLLWRMSQRNGELGTELKRLISKAAGIPNDQWESFARNPGALSDSIKGEPLTMVLLNLQTSESSADEVSVKKDFAFVGNRIPQPRDIHRAMEGTRHLGFYSLLQPEYLRTPTFSVDPEAEANGGRLTGTIPFHSGTLYGGAVQFAMTVNSDFDITVTEFVLPRSRIRIVRGEDGLWEKQELNLPN